MNGFYYRRPERSKCLAWFVIQRTKYCVLHWQPQHSLSTLLVGRLEVSKCLNGTSALHATTQALVSLASQDIMIRPHFHVSSAKSCQEQMISVPCRVHSRGHQGRPSPSPVNVLCYILDASHMHRKIHNRCYLRLRQAQSLATHNLCYQTLDEEPCAN